MPAHHVEYFFMCIFSSLAYLIADIVRNHRHLEPFVQQQMRLIVKIAQPPGP